MIEIVPSILSADFAQLGQQVREALEAGCRRIHIDVMDGQFVPNITMGPIVPQALRPHADRFDALLEVHLMIVQPERFLDDFRQAGADVIIVQVENAQNLNRTIQHIRGLGARPGVGVNPATPLSVLEEILPDVDQVLVMTVNPGFGGQELIASTVDKVTRLRSLLAQRGLEAIAIEVDGGIHAATIATVATAGADLAVSGSGVFDPAAPIRANVEALRLAAAGTGTRPDARRTPDARGSHERGRDI
jgi:ribulose-phosphate 3-epimerase